jgi:hypothetical protein
MSALKACAKTIALAALWAFTLALLVLSLGWMPLARATDPGKPLSLLATSTSASSCAQRNSDSITPRGKPMSLRRCSLSS